VVHAPPNQPPGFKVFQYLRKFDGTSDTEEFLDRYNRDMVNSGAHFK